MPLPSALPCAVTNPLNVPFCPKLRSFCVPEFPYIFGTQASDAVTEPAGLEPVAGLPELNQVPFFPKYSF